MLDKETGGTNWPDALASLCATDSLREVAIRWCRAVFDMFESTCGGSIFQLPSLPIVTSPGVCQSATSLITNPT